MTIFKTQVFQILPLRYSFRKMVGIGTYNIIYILICGDAYRLIRKHLEAERVILTPVLSMKHSLFLFHLVTELGSL